MRLFSAWWESPAVTRLGRYSKGSNGVGAELSQLLSIWSNVGFAINRKSEETKLIDDPAMCINGGIQPELLGKYTPLYANGKEPIIEEQDVYRIEIPYVPTLLPTIDESGKKTGKELEDVIKEAIRKDSSITIQEFQKLTGLSKNGIWNVLNRMKEQNKIKLIGPDKGGHWEVVGD